MKLLPGFDRDILKRVRHSNNSCGLSLGGDKHRRLAVVLQSLGLREQRLEWNTPFLHKLAVAEKDLSPLPLGFNAVAGDRVKPIRVRHLKSPLLGSPNDRFSQRML